MGEFYIFLQKVTSFIVAFIKWVELSILQAIPSHVEKWLADSYRNRMGVEFFGKGVSIKSQNHSENQNDKNGNNAKSDKSCDLEIHNPQFFSRIANQGSLGIGEAYIDEWWDCDNISELSYRIFKSRIFLEYLNPINRFFNYVQLSFFNLQSKTRSWEVAEKHYNIGL